MRDLESVSSCWYSSRNTWYTCEQRHAYVCVRVRVRVRVCVCACVRVCVRACLGGCKSLFLSLDLSLSTSLSLPVHLSAPNLGLLHETINLELKRFDLPPLLLKQHLQ